jgi:hypothetical protein
VRAPQGDGCAERFVRTLMENLLRVRRCDTIEEPRQALRDFQRTQDEQRLIARHGHRPPAGIGRGQTMTMQRAA